MRVEPITDKYPLSPMQQGMLFHSLSARQPGVDIEQVFCAPREDLNVAAFERAWQRVIQRHDILRTSFRWGEGPEPLQEVHRLVTFAVEHRYWREAPATEQQKLFETWLQADRLRGFELSQPPLMRVSLFQFGKADYQFVWTFHHVLLDARSIATVLNEVFAFYEAFNCGEELQLPPPRPYRGLIDWLQRQDLNAAEAFWRQTLKGFTTPTPLVVAHASDTKAEGGEIRGEHVIHLSETSTASLQTVAKENNLSLNTLVQGAWALLLSRYSGEEDVLFGAVRAGRRSTVQGAESIVGLFINTVPLRVPVPPTMPLLSWLKELRKQWSAVRNYEHTPLVKIQGWSEVAHGQPLFESLFNFQDPSWDAVLRAQGGNWAARGLGIRSQSNYPLAVDAYGGDALVIKILYHRNRFDDATVTRMLGHFKTLLEGMAANLDEQLSSLPLLTEAEREQLLVEWNDTRADFDKGKCVHEMFEQQADRTPNALAVADDSKQLTYGELNAQADRIATHLRSLGVGPEVCVGVCLERSVEMVVALLAVLKAGGAYVPLDPAYPKERLRFMLEDGKVPVLLTQKSVCHDEARDISALKVICMDTFSDASRVAHQESIRQSPWLLPHPNNLAYIIYTSGSTGAPKGVEIEHVSLVNLITWHQRTYNVKPADRATQLAGPAFDASVWELWPYLTAGASIHIPDEETRLSTAKLQNWLNAKQITLAFIPTPLVETLLNEPWPEGSALRAVLTGGDKLHRAPGDGFPCALINHYGPTENTVVTTSSTTVSPSTVTTGAPPIGRPILNSQVHVLDLHRQLVSIGVPGELYIGGVGLARGYRNHPELTAEKFIPDPFSRDPRARLYRTGDLVRYLPDGNIEFIGRADDQVKIRGHRIELGEIEVVLGLHPDVRAAVVIASEESPGKHRLTAYVVPMRGCEPRPRALREFAKQKLPEFMVPFDYVMLEALPLTPNGKVDRKALPAPDPSTRLADSFTPARTPTEEQLAGVWSEVLGLKRVGVQDNFFELGGHSLLATQVASRVRNLFQVEMPLHDLFDSPTIAGLAEKITALRRQPDVEHSENVARLSNGAQSISFAQERLWFMEQLEPGRAFNNIPVALRLEGALDIAALERALTEIIRRHEALRTVFHNTGGHPVAAVAPATPVRISIADIGSLPDAGREDKARQLMSEEAQRPFDLSRSPLLRASLLRLRDNEHLLFVTAHHIACDGWSMGVFHRELAALYEAYSKGRPSPLPELPIDYADFVRWQSEWLHGDVLEKQLAYWKQQLDGAQTTLELTADRPRPPVQTYRGATQHFSLPGRLTTALNSLARREDVTLFMLLLAAFQTLLHRYTGQEDILVGSPIAGRTRVETERLIGFFLNTLVLRGDLSGDPTFRELLKRVRKTALGAYAHQDLPFEKLMDVLQLERDLSRPPLFQVMFILQNEPSQPLELAGLKVTPLPTHSGTAKFDLTLSLEETGDRLSGYVEFNTDLFDSETITRLLGHYQTLLESVVTDAGQRLSQLALPTAAERKQILVEWNDTSADFQKDKCVHELFEAQVARAPNAVAVVFGDEHLTYGELNERANEVASRLRGLGIGPDVRVGICVRRSLEMMVGLLGILKAGGCYVPLDPAYPKERVAFMLDDSKAPVLVTQEKLLDDFKPEIPAVKLLCLDASHHTPHDSDQKVEIQKPKSDDLAYVLYTSGSTGKPKGVMVTHRNVVNFFAGMDRVFGTDPGVWLAVTSISFDISVLELFWTLARGFKVIIQDEEQRTHGAARSVKPVDGKIDFSLFYFASNADERATNGAQDKYRLLIEGAKFADQHGFAAVWTPERHFHPFGGIFPNPSVTGAAVAMVTKRLQIRAGSVCLPLHHPIRVAEEWSVLDNLSRGRVAVAFASGWHANDFALAPDNYAGRKEIMFQDIDMVRRLWRGEAVGFVGGTGDKVEVKIFPKPVQRELPIWITSSGSPETFCLAGEHGANLLTFLSVQGIEHLAKKIATYREARREKGHPGEGVVTLMLHTFVCENSDGLREKVRGPLREYLQTFRDLTANARANRTPAPPAAPANDDTAKEQMEMLLDNAVDRYIETSSLIGTPETCQHMVDKLAAIGVDEIACLIDFGLDADSVLASLEWLNQLRDRSNRPSSASARGDGQTDGQGRSVSEQILRHGVSHMQCTPSLARTLVLDPGSLPAMRRLSKLLLGGEALPVSLAQQLGGIVPCLLNMYGPTETTIWSAVHRVETVANPVPIGRPVANTQIYILDRNLQPVPIGVPGEIFIGGEGVARGYLNRPELTAEKFIGNPFNTDANARIYRTGDLGRWLADGSIEFLGRLDNQVKIRGHRIELGEIESALGRHPTVREAVVVAREDAPGDNRLVAYVVAAPGAEPTASELRQLAQEKLPEAMVPSAFVFLDALPLTPNGKVNRKALPAPEGRRPALETAYVAPQTNFEKSITTVWQELLRVEKVGLHDNFFDLGGHSLLVVQAQARLRDTLGFDLPVVKLFQYPTVSALAGFLSERKQPSFDKVRDRGRRKQAAFARRAGQQHEVMA